MNNANCKGGGGDYKEGCYFHPKENNIVGVCHLCLYDKLLILANNNKNIYSNQNHNSTFQSKIFAFGSFINPFEFRHRKHARNADSDASTSHEDSFISIKFENNGVGSWDKGKVSSIDSGPQKSVVEHVKTRATLRWPKRIGHMFQVIKWKRSNKGSTCHVGSKVEGVKVKNYKGWIRNLTKRRTKE